MRDSNARRSARAAPCDGWRSRAVRTAALRSKDIPTLRDAANRWTDNCFELRKYCIEKGGMDPKLVDHELNTDSIDYVD